MIIVKLIVIFGCINGFSARRSNFCEICLNHTLCIYKTAGPGPTCKYYDSTALLTKRDVTELINRINERRNFVAMGYSKILPRAANMKKLRWSSELATFAQRWVDQCNPSVRPDKEDQCRDLENVKVGQNIGSVIGPSPGLNVKSFVEMWFIQALDYAGSVTFYNKSRDYKTVYFTQLIWAETEFVGCGKAKFYVDERNLMLERLVCNFSPKGNTHGKPVYSIGYPATQCKNGMIPDDKYKGLCAYNDYGIRNIVSKLTTQKHPAISLLKILNLSDDSMKHEIDPIRNNLKQINVNSNSSIEQRNQKTRHIFPNKTYAAVKRIPLLRKQNMGKSLINISNNDNMYHYKHDRGHSHLYHGHEPPRYIYEMSTTINTNQDFRRYDYTTESINSYSNNNYRKFNQYGQCTRRMIPQNDCASNQCSREPDDCCQQTTMRPSTCTEIPCTNQVDDHICPFPCITQSPPDLCACTKHTCPSISTNCNYDINCPCSTPCAKNTHCYTSICPGIRRQNNDYNDYRRSDMTTFQYYDMIPNVVVRSGNHKLLEENTSQKKGLRFFDNSDIMNSYKTIYENKEYDELHNDGTDHPKYDLQDHDYRYHTFHSSLRKRRQLDDEATVKPFWQIENFNHKNPSQLRSMKYTTLPNRKYKKTRRSMESAKWLTSTEPITLNLADYDEDQEHVTEKYLSFDELMHFRKNSEAFAQYDFRRNKKKGKGEGNKTTKAKAKGNSTKKPSNKTKSNSTKEKKTTTTAVTVTTITTKPTTIITTEYTANTPYERKKHCTRKLTCTWTAFTGYIEGGGGGGGGGGGSKYIGLGVEIGSRTPPGYVEGCTRTSTCTRDFMDRNKIATSSDENSSGGTAEDEEYCERRSLNVQRRNSDEIKPSARIFSYRDQREFSISKADYIRDHIFNTNIDTATESISKTHDCICKKRNARKKRQGIEHLRNNQEHCGCSKKSFSYGDIYYLVLNKILKSNQAHALYNNKCPCNGSTNFSPTQILLFLFFLIR